MKRLADQMASAYIAKKISNFVGWENTKRFVVRNETTSAFVVGLVETKLT
jgi:hypothetical protein